MSNSVNRPRGKISQAPLKITSCFAGCGAEVKFRTNPKIICPSCKPERIAQQARCSASLQRRKRGVPEVKGKVILCAECRVQVTLDRNPRAKYCQSCYLKINGDDSVVRSKRKRATPEGRAYNNAWTKNKRDSDPSWKISAHMRVLIGRGLKSRKQGRSWTEFVPYTVAELMLHLERQFLPGMSWENRSLWHIDHVLPRKLFSYKSPDDPEFKAAWALTNLRPLWGVDNLKKSGTRTHLL